MHPVGRVFEVVCSIYSGFDSSCLWDASCFPFFLFGRQKDLLVVFFSHLVLILSLLMKLGLGKYQWSYCWLIWDFILFNHLILFSIGYRWITKFFALTLYALLLMPGFLQGKITLSPMCSHIGSCAIADGFKIFYKSYSSLQTWKFIFFQV